MPTSSVPALLPLLWVVIVACGGPTLPTAVAAETPVGDRVAVSSMPPPALTEEVPPQPNDDTVWADGCWEPSANSWVWVRGGWVVPPRGASLFRGRLDVGDDGALWWQPCTWISDGKAIEWVRPVTPANFPLSERTIYDPPS